MLETLYPHACAACGEAADAPPLCDECAGRLSVSHLEPPPPGLQEVFTVDRYDGPVGSAVASAKAAGDRERLVRLGDALAAVARDWVAGSFFDAVVPCPSPWTRRLRRGFSPGHVLADRVARTHGLPRVDALAVAPGQRQSKLGESERAHNLVGRLRRRTEVRGRVLLVDDVVTTGATMASCARVLGSEGDVEVWGLAICRVQRDPVRTSRTTDEGP